MTCLQFSGSSYVLTSIGGALPTLGSGDRTYAALVRPENITDWFFSINQSGRSSAGSWTAFAIEGGGMNCYPTSGSAIEPVGKGWILAVVSITAGGEYLFGCYFFESEEWMWNAQSSSGPATGGPGEVVELGQWNHGEQFGGLYADMSVWGYAMSQGELENLLSLGSVAAWLETSPLALWDFQESHAEYDVTGNGANIIGSGEVEFVGEEVPLPYGGEEPPPPPAVSSIVSPRRPARGLLLRGRR